MPWTSWRDRPLYVQEGDRVNRPLGDRRAVRPLPVDVFEEWVRRDVGTVYVQMFDVALANWVGEPPSLCIHSETCGIALALEHTGDLYSCDHFVEPKLPAGQHPRNAHARARRVAAAAPLRTGQARPLPRLLPRVRCALRLPRRVPQGPLHLDTRRRARPQLPVRGLQVVLPPRRPADAINVGTARRGEAPAEVMRIYAQEDARRGRNEPCTCGSGLKWKRCHGWIQRSGTTLAV